MLIFLFQSFGPHRWPCSYWIGDLENYLQTINAIHLSNLRSETKRRPRKKSLWTSLRVSQDLPLRDTTHPTRVVDILSSTRSNVDTLELQRRTNKRRHLTQAHPLQGDRAWMPMALSRTQHQVDSGAQDTTTTTRIWEPLPLLITIIEHPLVRRRCLNPISVNRWLAGQCSTQIRMQLSEPRLVTVRRHPSKGSHQVMRVIPGIGDIINLSPCMDEMRWTNICLLIFSFYFYAQV